jgi:LysM repeat protein
MYGTTTTAIAQANNLANPSLIRTGQRLVIPGVSGPVSGSTSTGSRTYIVQRGDNLSRIAAKYGVTVDAIVKANNLKNASLIYAGQKLIIP